MNNELTPVGSILVVDDTVENLRLLATVLGDHGYEVRPVTNGRQALLAIEHDPPALVLLDINMPEMDGYEVCRRIKEGRNSRDIPVIFLTALTATTEIIKAFDAGGVDYITKPFQVEEVFARVKTHVELQRARQALARSYERLRELEQLRDNLVNMVVHDMRTPLHILMTNISILQSIPELDGNDDVMQELDEAMQTVNVLARMTNDLLDVSRLEERKMPLQIASCDVTQIAHAVATNLASLDLDRRIDVESNGPVQVPCDGGLVHGVLENLVTNGIKYTPPGGRLHIAVATDGNGARVSVQDQGPGDPGRSHGTDMREIRDAQRSDGREIPLRRIGARLLQTCRRGARWSNSVLCPMEGGSLFWFELPD